MADQSDKNRIWKKIELIYKALQKPSSWYTGIPIKRYLRKNILDLQTPKFNNPAINSGRWSAYCHYSQEQALRNLLEKNRIEYGSTVIVHPLLPKNLIDVLLQKEVELIFLDIDKATLSLDPNQIHQKIFTRRESKPVDLIIHYGVNGLYEEVCKSLKIAQQSVIPSILVMDDPTINLSLIDAFESLAFGGVIWNFGDSFFDEQLDVVLDTTLESYPWFVSFQIETRTLSVLEYHLSQSHQEALPLIKAYFYLLLDHYRKIHWMGKIYFFLYSLPWFSGDIDSIPDAQNKLKEKYNNLFEKSAVPDLAFDLQITSPEVETISATSEEIIERSAKYQERAKDLYDYFIKEVPNRPESSLEIPNFFLDRNYTKYFFYTTDPQVWETELKNLGFETQKPFQIHETVQQNKKLPNANFVVQYGMLVVI